MTVTIEQLSVHMDSNLRHALEVIDRYAHGICFVVSDEGKLVGLMTDGDVRRALLQGAQLTAPVRDVMQKKFVSLPVNSDEEAIQKCLTPSIRVIPLVDASGKPVDFASSHRLRRIQVAEPLLDGNELAYVTDCIKTNWISSQGSYVRKFESQLAEYCGMPHACAVSNGTVAIHLALEALRIGPGDEVIVPDMTFAASINAVIYTGATPVIVDVQKSGLSMDPEQVEAAITPRTKAIMPVHLYGYPCDMDALMEIARKHRLRVVEDCAEALGTRFKEKHVGSFGDVSTFSFFGNKTITTGEGGMVLFKDASLYEHAAMLRDHGMSRQKRYWHEEVGYNYRLTNLQAAIGVAQMERVDQFVEAKRRIARMYGERLAQFPELKLPSESEDVLNTYWLYTLTVTETSSVTRDELVEKLLLNGVETRRVFYPLHEMPPYRKYVRQGQTFPVSDGFSRMGLSLPSAVTLGAADIDHIGRALGSILRAKRLIASPGV